MENKFHVKFFFQTYIHFNSITLELIVMRLGAGKLCVNKLLNFIYFFKIF